jgi:hypothetical protein
MVAAHAYDVRAAKEVCVLLNLVTILIHPRRGFLPSPLLDFPRHRAFLGHALTRSPSSVECARSMSTATPRTQARTCARSRRTSTGSSTAPRAPDRVAGSLRLRTAWGRECVVRHVVGCEGGGSFTPAKHACIMLPCQMHYVGLWLADWRSQSGTRTRTWVDRDSVSCAAPCTYTSLTGVLFER